MMAEKTDPSAMRAALSFAALFLSIFLVQLGSGSLAPLDALAGSARGFSTAEIGLLGSAHFAGFFIGCWLMPRFIGDVGHSRSFAVAAAFGALGALLHPVLEGPYYWAILRLGTGFAISSAYTVIESWLHAKTDNAVRGRVYGTYRLVDLAGQIIAQAMIAVLDPAGYVAYNIVAVFCCLCLLPLSLSRRVPPKIPNAPRLRPLKAALLSPSATIGLVVSGLTSASFRMVGPLFALDYALDQGQIAVFLGLSIVGGMAAQYPVGWLADAFDRRKVVIGLSVAAILVCVWTVKAIDPAQVSSLYLAAFLFGLTSLPVYSVSAALANDFAPEDFVVELNAAVVFFYSIGAVISPVVTAGLVALYGPEAMFVFIAGAHGVLILFAIYRMTRRRRLVPVVPYQYLPRTSMVLARLFRRPPPPDAAPLETPPEQNKDPRP